MKAALALVCAAAALAAGTANATRQRSETTQRSEQQRFADALALAVEKAWTDDATRYRFSDFSCTPVRGVTVWMERVYLCHAYEHIVRNGTTLYGAAYVLADGGFVEPSEVGRPLDAPPFRV